MTWYGQGAAYATTPGIQLPQPQPAAPLWPGYSSQPPPAAPQVPPAHMPPVAMPPAPAVVSERGSEHDQSKHRRGSKEKVDMLKDQGKNVMAALGHALLAKAFRLDPVEVYHFGAAPQKNGSWKYIDDGSRYDQEERKLRREIAELTISVVETGSYHLAGGRSVAVDRWPEMVKETQVVTCPSDASLTRAPHAAHGHHGPAILRGTCTNPMEEALQVKGAAPRGRVACINPASAYHCCGAFLTGGLHAKEEQMCVMSTLFKGMQQAEVIAAAAAPMQPYPGVIRPSKSPMHIPETSAVLCPGVEVFRRGPSSGYEFLDAAVAVDVVSIAMPNCNPDVRDSALYDPNADTYDELVRRKWMAALEAARQAKADTLIVPAAGCGVFRNPSQKVAQHLAEVLQLPRYWNHFSKVVVVAPPAFYSELERSLMASRR